MPLINSDKTRRDAYLAVAFFCIISVIALPIGAFLAYRAWKIHRKISNPQDTLSG